MKKIEEIEEINELEEIMDEDGIPEKYKTNLNTFLTKFPKVQPLWHKIKDDILPAFYAKMHNNRLYYFMEFRVIKGILWCGIFREGDGNLESNPCRAKIKAEMGNVAIWDIEVTLLLVQYIIAKIICDRQIIIAGYTDHRDMESTMKLIQKNPIFDMKGYAWEMFHQMRVSFTIGTHD